MIVSWKRMEKEEEDNKRRRSMRRRRRKRRRGTCGLLVLCDKVHKGLRSKILHPTNQLRIIIYIQ